MTVAQTIAVSVEMEGGHFFQMSLGAGDDRICKWFGSGERHTHRERIGLLILSAEEEIGLGEMQVG